MELSEYVRIIRKRLSLIIGATILSIAAALSVSLATVPVYEGQAKLLVIAKTEPGGGISSAYAGALLSQQLVKSFAQVLESRATAEAALRLDPQPFSANDLQGRIHAEPIIETLLIDLKVEDNDPARARRLTNDVARAFIATVPDLQRGSTLQVSQVEPALLPTKPVRPRTKTNLALGTLIGLLLGIGLAVLRDILDNSVQTPEELEVTAGAPVVGTIPPFKAGRSQIPVAEQPRTSAAEAFRKLRTNFAFLDVDRESICCVVTSPGVGNGKSIVTANLALALTQAGQRVVIVDADLRKPTQHKIFGLPQRVGATTALLDQVDVVDALRHPISDGPAVLPSGQLPPNPSELLGSRRMAELLNKLRSMADVVLIDCPPLLPVTDPMVLSQFADGVLLVVRAGTTSRDEVKAARATCAKVGATVFGVVLNGTQVAEGNQPSYYAYYGETIQQSTEVEHALSLNGSSANTYRTEATRASRLGDRTRSWTRS